MKWFGKSWGAPACDPQDHVDTPLGKLCPSCDRAILGDHQGVMLTQLSDLTGATGGHGGAGSDVSPSQSSSLPAGSTIGVLEVRPWHLHCFLRNLGIERPVSSKVLEALQRAAYMNVSDPVVHVLAEGFAVCGKPGVPGSWEPGQIWVRIEDADKATCPECISRATPHRTGKPAQALSLTGMLMPWNAADSLRNIAEGPVLLAMPRSTALYLPCFSSADLLRATMQRAGIHFTKIKIIEDGAEFLDSIPSVLGGDGPSLHIIADPYFTDDGTVRFNQVLGAN